MKSLTKQVRVNSKYNAKVLPERMSYNEILGLGLFPAYFLEWLERQGLVDESLDSIDIKWQARVAHIKKYGYVPYYKAVPKYRGTHKEKAKIVLRGLQTIKATAQENTSLGICSSLEWETGSQEYGTILRSLFLLWPKFSGDLAYPVPSDLRPAYTAKLRFAFAANHKSFWRKETQYGRDRWELLEFLIKEIKKRL